MRALAATPLRTFTLVSLALIAATVLAAGFGLSAFFRQAMLAREAVIIADLAQAAVTRELTLAELDARDDPQTRLHLERAFGGLRELSDVVLVKVFDRDAMLVWSDDAALIGTRARRGGDVERALAGATSTVFYDKGVVPGLGDDPVVEFYVPLRLPAEAGGAPVTGAVMAMYRSAVALNAVIDRGVRRVWLTVSVGGLLLYLALAGLHRAVLARQREAERRFDALSSEHARVVQMEKLSTIGQMVGEIAHQFNNPLVGVVNLTQLAERHADDPARVRELLGEIRKAGEHCSGYVQRMLRFTQLARAEPQPVALDALARDTVTLFRQTAGAAPAVDCRAAAGAETATVQADPVLLRHALFNLIQNAAQADPAGPIAVELAAASHDGAPGWRLAVRDHGPGVSPQALPQLFTPFFSTRPGGTGLGLPVARHIAVQHGGELWAEAAGGGGARFVLWLPAKEGLA